MLIFYFLQELVDCCASLSVNKDAVKDLVNLMSTLSGLYQDVEANLKEIGQLINVSLIYCSIIKLWQSPFLIAAEE